MTIKSNLLSGVVMTPTERRLGRYLRAPEGHGEGGEGGGGDGGATFNAADPPETLETLAGVPIKLQGLYVKEGAKFVYKDPAALRNAYDTTKTERNQLRQKATIATELEGLGLTMDEVKELAAARKTAEEDRLKKEGDFESLKKQIEDNHKTELDKRDAREKKLLTTLERTMVDADARAVLAEEDLQGNPTLLLPHIRDRVKIVETDEGFERQVLLADGKTPMLSADNKPATLKDLFTELKAKQEFGGAFKGINQSGGGTPPNGGGGGTPPGSLKRSEMTAPQRVAYMEKNGQEAYLKLPA